MRAQMEAIILKMRMLFETGPMLTMTMTITMMQTVALVVSLERAQSTQLVGSDSSLWLQRHLHSTHSYTIGYIGHITEQLKQNLFLYFTLFSFRSFLIVLHGSRFMIQQPFTSTQYNHFLTYILCTSLQDYLQFVVHSARLHLHLESCLHV